MARKNEIKLRSVEVSIPLTDEENAFAEEEAKKAGMKKGEWLAHLVAAEHWGAGHGEKRQWGRWREETRRTAERGAREWERVRWASLSRLCKPGDCAEALWANNVAFVGEDSPFRAVSFAKRSAETVAEFLVQAARMGGGGQDALLEESRRLCERLKAVLFEIGLAGDEANGALSRRICERCAPERKEA